MKHVPFKEKKVVKTFLLFYCKAHTSPKVNVAADINLSNQFIFIWSYKLLYHNINSVYVNQQKDHEQNKNYIDRDSKEQITVPSYGSQTT